MTEQEPRTIRKIHNITLLLAAAAVMAVVSGRSGFVVRAVPGAPIAGNAAAGTMAAPREVSGSSIVTSGELAIFDAETGTLLEKLAVGKGRTTSASRRKPEKPLSPPRRTMRSRRYLETMATESIPVGPLPHHIEPSHDGRKIFVTLASHPMTVPAPGTPAFATIDTDDNSVTYTATSANPAARAHAVFPTPDGDRMFVAHDTGNEVSGVDMETGDIFLSISPIVRAEEVVATRFGISSGSRRAATYRQAFDIATRAVDSVPVGPPSLTRVGHADAERAHAGGEHRGMPAALAFVDTARLELIGTVQIGPAGSNGELAVMSGNGHYVFATFDNLAGGTGGVAVVDVRTRTVVRDWQYPGTGRPHGIWHSRKKPRF